MDNKNDKRTTFVLADELKAFRNNRLNAAHDNFNLQEFQSEMLEHMEGIIPTDKEMAYTKRALVRPPLSEEMAFMELDRMELFQILKNAEKDVVTKKYCDIQDLIDADADLAEQIRAKQLAADKECATYAEWKANTDAAEALLRKVENCMLINTNNRDRILEYMEGMAQL